MNDLGFYRGGVPRENRGAIRGDSLGVPGEFHSPGVHNFIHNQHQDSHRVTSEDAVQFKHYMRSDEMDFKRSKPAWPMYYDKDFNYRKDRIFWLRFLIGAAGISYLFAKYEMEVMRARRTERMEGYKNIPGHHFANRGGVIVLKQFVGFEKYYNNSDDVYAWYQKVYPGQFKS